MNGKRIIIAGGTGFIGRAIARELAARGAEVAILTRSPQASPTVGHHVQWDGKTTGDWVREIEGADAVINLAGKNVNCRYTPAALAEVDESRMNAVIAINTAIARSNHPPRVLIQATTTAIYGDTGDRWVDESTPPGYGVPPLTALKWEHAFVAHPTPQTRRVTLRISFVLGRDGGALSMLSMLTRYFLGGAVGNGRQYISWIHIDDLTRLVVRAIEDETMAGLYNASAPNPVTNAEFMRELRRVHRRPWSPPTPAPLVRIGCFIIRTEPVLALTGRRVLPKRLADAGFSFRFPELRAALVDIVQTPAPAHDSN
ncbi:MAG TPA: TIGR01777 family oxidoreductase [Tepidisphaeraceae bacterium]|nr:TIGR01777 family oxidoreductase [Tepidisphaeraceae bacterium]